MDYDVGRSRLLLVAAELASAITQAAHSDDAIILQHIRTAYRIVKDLLEYQRGYSDRMTGHEPGPPPRQHVAERRNYMDGYNAANKACVPSMEEALKIIAKIEND